MTAITLTEANAQLDAWVAASRALATSSSYSIGGRSLTRADGEEVRQQINYWENRIVQLTATAAGRSVTRHSVATWT